MLNFANQLMMQLQIKRENDSIIGIDNKIQIQNDLISQMIFKVNQIDDSMKNISQILKTCE